MDGAELNALQNLCCGPDFRLDLLSGFRYFEVDEGLGITENLLVDATFPAGAGNTGAGTAAATEVIERWRLTT